MSELTVVLDKNQLAVSLESGGVLRMDQPGCMPEKIPLNLIRQVIVYGKPMVACDVWRAFSERNIPAVLLPSRGKGDPAYLSAALSSTAVNRFGQYRAAMDRDLSLRIGRRLIELKLSGQEAVLKEMDSAEGSGACKAWDRIGEIRKDLLRAENLDSLRGHEGAAAAIYFREWARQLPEKWGFSGRNRRPPKDPVNALLSLSYVIAGGEIRRGIQKRGLDPAVGFFHALEPERDNMVLDILEPVRPAVDLFVLGIMEKLSPRDFNTSRDGCRLSKPARRTFYQAWAVRMEMEEEGNPAIRSAIRESIREVIRFLDPDY